ncbi:hypothetical protein NDI47_04825 [Microcoleus vaginatus GB1-A2]|uniref:hypothetical protein n=1 Tax=Microcoleus vaginatus TaxID=119532 RepID=UPI00168241E5|nr:hypothetical protein [Microcoleus sp. FACHB-61]
MNCTQFLCLSAWYSQLIIAPANRRRFDGYFGQEWLIVEQLPGLILPIVADVDCFILCAIERSL